MKILGRSRAFASRRSCRPSPRRCAQQLESTLVPRATVATEMWWPLAARAASVVCGWLMPSVSRIMWRFEELSRISALARAQPEVDVRAAVGLEASILRPTASSRATECDAPQSDQRCGARCRSRCPRTRRVVGANVRVLRAARCAIWIFGTPAEGRPCCPSGRAPAPARRYGAGGRRGRGWSPAACARAG